jgi:thioredoxin 1
MQITLIVLGSLILIFVVIQYTARAQMKKIPAVADSDKIITLTDKNFNQQVKNKVVLIDFWASWCAPCRMMAPVLNDVANELSGNTHVGKVNIEQYKSLAQKYNVRSIPTLILLKNGNEVNRFIGVKTKDFLMKQLQKI